MVPAKSMWETDEDNADWTHLVHTAAARWTY